MRDLHIRVPDEVNTKLNSLAHKKQMSKNELIKNILTDYAINPEIRNIEDKYANVVKDVSMLFQSELERNREQLEENTHLLKQIKEKLEGGI